MYLLRLDDFDIVGSSPEALVSVKGTTAVTHPIAGSKPRGGTPAEDAALEAELLADPKERAEHVMLVDLGRNDLGRVCQPGTVEVVEFMEVRRYSHIMHLESTVTGTIAEDRTALDVVLAAFPAGTLSGAPKVRAMEIIDELEITRRGLYGGVVGYLDFAGDADAAIAIRTAVVRDGVAFVQAGGGIVADSDPPTEDQETQNKAAAVVKAISVAESFASVAPSEARPTAESAAR
jgi:anthranilate synthase component 1